MKIRVNELSKKISEIVNKKVENKEIIQKLKENGVDVKSHSSNVEEKDAKNVIDNYKNSNKQEKKNTENKPQSATKPKENKPQSTTKPKENKPQSTAKPKENKPQPNNTKRQNSRKKQNNRKAEKKISEDMIDENVENDIKFVQIEETITVKDLAMKIGTTSSDLLFRLMNHGVIANLNQDIDFGLASSICEEFEILAEVIEKVDMLEEIFREDEEGNNLTERPPVVVAMGHVDHGKTSLLDAIRKSSVTKNEAGGITQHIGAYTVAIGDKPITFLDTPGHEAFTAMRMRGASITDIAVLVVAADDGVMPQTIEAINHAKAAGVDIIVAINKIDKESANLDRVKQELSEYGLLSEDWGGDTICVPVSALTEEGLDTLLEMIILVSELKELKADIDKKARGTIIESELHKGRGPVATVLVQSGTLKIGDPIVAGTTYGKIRAMMNDKGHKVKEAGPSIPVEILGLNAVPLAGDAFYVAKGDKHARQISESVIARDRVNMIKNTPQKVSLDDLFVQIQSGNMKELNIVIKADVQGSVEAVRQSLEKLSNEEVRIKTIHGGVGAITESDVMLASASNAIIIGFNVRPENIAKTVADEQKVDVRLYRVIYSAIEDIASAMKGMLDPILEEKVIGHVEIRQIFKASGVGSIGGSYVTDGKITRNSQVRIIRNGIVAFEGMLASLKRHQDDAKEVNAGYECGLLFEKYNDIKEGDIVEAFIMEEIPR